MRIYLLLTGLIYVGFWNGTHENWNMKPPARSRNDASKFDGSSTARPEVAELEYVLADTAFAASPRRRKLLRYLVDETLAGRADRLTAVPIAQSVFHRDETFDHQTDPVVRVEARRLRHDLDRYYADAGRTRPLRISIPKGHYAVQFVQQPHPHDAGDRPDEPASPKYTLDRRTAVALAAAIILAIFVATAWQKYGRDAVPLTVASIGDVSMLELPKGPAIAVLPFFNISGSADKQYVADGISQQLVTELARFDQLRVLPLGSLQRYKDGIADPREIQREFGAAFILEGSVGVSDDTVRITSRLIETATARYVWVKNFSEKLTPANIYDVQDTIAQEVAANLGSKYGVVARANTMLSKRKAPESIVAYDCVLRYYDYQSSINPENYSSVKECLERAVAIEPDYAEAWAVLANLYMQSVRFGYGSDHLAEKAAAKAKSAATRALEIDPQSATGNIILANLLFTAGDISGFREMAERALINNPNDTDVLAHFGLRLALIGDWDRGLPLLKRAVALNPAYPSWYRFAWVFYHYERREYETALEEINKINMPGFFWTHIMRAAILAQLGRVEEATAAVSQLLSLDDNFRNEGRAFINVWQFPEPLSMAIIEGLEKAGLHLVDEQKR